MCDLVDLKNNNICFDYWYKCPNYIMILSHGNHHDIIFTVTEAELYLANELNILSLIYGIIGGNIINC